MKRENYKIENIIWDWNGTLLNDVDISIRAMNKLLKKRNLPLLIKERYLDAFTFPVRNYYEKIGFDFNKEAFEIPALEFMDEYHNLLTTSTVFEEAERVLKKIAKIEIRQFILSAMKETALKSSLQHFNIIGYFKGIAGIRDDLAYGKIDRGKTLISCYAIDPLKTILVGDTLHDAEVAEKLGCQCLLISHGHQSIKKLEKSNAIIISNLDELINYIVSR